MLLCADLMTMAERELSAFFNAITQLFGLEQARALAKDWLPGVDRDRWSAASTREWRLITAKVFDSARKPSERFVPIVVLIVVHIDPNHKLLRGKEYACSCYRCYRLHWYGSRSRAD